MRVKGGFVTRRRHKKILDFIHGLKVANVRLDRKALADLAVRDEAAFAAVVDVARTALA